MFHQGQQIGAYTLINRIGRGGFGEVWLAEKRSQFLTKKVAIKLPHDEQVDFEAIRHEATLWEQASGHANVLPIIDADVYGGQVVIVSEYADGGSLADKLKSAGKFPTRQAVELAVGVLNGLEYLHNKRIIHRDIKPANILLQGDTPRLADFGVSRAMQTTRVSSKIIGTDAYMSPESFRGLRTVETDIWAMGVVLYQLLDGRLPFPQENPSERMYAILQEEFAPLPEGLSPELRRIVEKALAKRPENRYRSAGEMRDELKSFLSPPAPPTPVVIPTPVKPRPPVNPVHVPAPAPDDGTATYVRPTPPAPAPRPAVPPAPKPPAAPRPDPPAPTAGDSRWPRRNWVYLAVVGVVFLTVPMVGLIVGVGVGSGLQSNVSNVSNSNYAVNRALLSTPTPVPTPTPSYDIPALRADVADLKLFESGEGSLPAEQRTYATTFYKSATRYINYELKLSHLAPEGTRYFTLERIWSKGGTVIHSSSASHSIEDPWTATTFTGGYGNASSGSFAAGSYKLDIRCDGKVVASKNFDVQISLAGTWSGATWGNVTMSGSGASYTGSYTTAPSGTFNLTRAADGLYRGSWRSTNGSEGGTIERALVSADGNTVTVTWGYSYPEALKASGRVSTWTRKKN
ncbi:MAG: serine/threonine-protein kinase [Pyrinomonadaceae bacterium]